MDKFRVCIVADVDVPQFFIHHQVFQEVGLGLWYSFLSLGIDCDMKVNELAADRVNILLGYHNLSLAPNLGGFRSYRYIPYQLEQLSGCEDYFGDRHVLGEIFAGSHAIWDFSMANVEFLKRMGYAAKHLPIGYHPRLQTISQNGAKDIDVFFAGCNTQRRAEFFGQMGSTTRLRVLHVFGVYGKQRDDLLARSRVVLNIHRYPRGLLEATRIAYALNNGCFVLSETCVDNPYPTINLRFAELPELAPLCEYYAARPAEAESLASTWRDTFQRDYSFVELLKQVL